MRCAMASSSFKIVSLGGGNASGYLARGLIGSSKLQRGDLAIITDEPVGLPPVSRSANFRIFRNLPVLRGQVTGHRLVYQHWMPCWVHE